MTARAFPQMRVFFAVLLALGTMCGLVAVVVMIGPAIESRLAPVLTDARFTVVDRRHGRMVIDWVARRGREQCEFVSAVALVRRGEEWHSAVLSRAGDDTDEPLRGSTRPAGFQRFTRLDVIPEGSALRLTLRHRCHPLWVTVTHLPAVELP